MRVPVLLLFLTQPAFSALAAQRGAPATPASQKTEADPGPLFQGLTISMVYPRNTVTHYSATPRGGRSCPLEGGNGGPDSSPSGFRPLSYRIDKPGVIHGRTAVLAAVPIEGGNSGMFGCFFGLPDAYPGVLFYAGDRYGPDSNYKVKTDVSSPCTPIVNKTMLSRAVAYNCPGKKGGFAPPLQRASAEEPVKKEPAKAEPPRREAAAPAPALAEKPAAPEGGACRWFSVLLCNRTLEASNEDRARLGGAELEVIRTSDYSNLNGGWYCVVSPAASQAEASVRARSFGTRAPSAYAKKGCS